MTVFWILAAGLIGLALLFVALPLLHKPDAAGGPDQDSLNLQVFRQRLQELDADLASGFLEQGQYEAARHDLERELLYDIDGTGTAQTPGATGGRWMAAVLAVAVPAAAVLLYTQIGSSDMIERIEASAGGATAADAPAAGGMPPLEVLVERLAARLENEPDNLEGWLMLGRTYFAVRQPENALKALEHAYALAPDQINVVLALAEAVAANNGNRLDGRAGELVDAALVLEPANPTARWLSGMLAFQRGDYPAAATTWQAIADEMDPASEEVQRIQEMIAEANARAGKPGRTPAIQTPADRPAPENAAATPEAPAGEVAPAAITVEVVLDPALAGSVAPDDALFVFARAAAGPPMPLAVQRLQAKDLPATVKLDDSMAMMPAMRLSAFPEVIVGARISKTGQATPQSGDLEGETGPVPSAQTERASVVIGRARP